MAAVETNGTRAEGGFEAWSGMLTDAVVKCGRDSERKLYMYGISFTRCPKCQARIRAETNTCISCHYTHKTLRKCMRCSQKNEPVMWCAECDAYFCASCHKKPHVLMLGSTKPHHCFAIDGASGKHFAKAAWSDEFTAKVQATYRLRLHDKMMADGAKASTKEATGEQATPLVNGAAGKAASVGSASSTALPPVTSAPMNDAAGVSAATTTPTIGAQHPSRKRQLPGPEETRQRIQKSIRANEASRLGGKLTPASTDGMSLYDRVKAMHDMRAKSAATSNTLQPRSLKMSSNLLLSQQNEKHMRQKREQDEQAKRKTDHKRQHQGGQHRQQQQEQERVEPSKKEQQRLGKEGAQHLRYEQRRLDIERIERLRVEKQQKEQQQQEEQQRQKEQRQLHEEQRRQDEQRQQTEQQQQEELRQQEEQRRQKDQRRQEELHLQQQVQEKQQQQRLMEERMRHEQILRAQKARHQLESQSLVHESNRYVSQAQHILHSQPGYAIASMAPSNVSASMPPSSNDRFTRVPSPVNVFPHVPRFQPTSPAPTPQGFPFQSTHDVPVTSGYSSMGTEHGSQVYQGHSGVPVTRFETILQDHDGNHHLVVRDPNLHQQQQSDFSDAMVPHRMTAVAGGGGVFSPSKSGEDDELRAIWVSDYDKVNALVMQLDMEITKRTEEGHKFVHMSNNITIPEQLKLQIDDLRAQRDAAIKKRFESAIRVLIFSEAVRSFAQQNEQTVWSDVPEVLKASHKKCAELSTDIRECEQQAQKLREGIDEAVSSGNPAQMQNVAHLGALIADLERKIRTSNGKRDKQFIFMFQFSDTLRNMVRAEWAASGRGYHVQTSQ